MSSIKRIIDPKITDLGEFSVRRALPSTGLKMVGPFIFFDHFGPAQFEPGQGVSVRPHPHIGIATVTYLFDGEIIHRDSLGYEQAILPGAVNWMTAGRGIVHSERSRPEVVDSGSTIHGLQSWVALPLEDEECEPDFTHYPAEQLPEMEKDGVWMRLICGSAFGMKSSVKTRSPIFYLDVKAEQGASVSLPEEHTERAIYTVSGNIQVEDEVIAPGNLVVINEQSSPGIQVLENSQFMMLGGEPLKGKRTIWWNFVSSRPERIEQAKSDWKSGKFDSVPGDTEFIPLPE